MGAIFRYDCCMASTQYFRLHWWKIALAVILVVAAGLIFFRLTRADVQTDAGHYAMRAVGYVDFLDSMKQTTPLQWYDPNPPPLWTRLSFHDHPPLVFFIQHLFFKFFGVSDTVALVPFAISGLACVLLLFLIGKRLGGPLTGVLAAGMLSVATFFTWGSRIGYLEGVENAFILLCAWLFLKSEDEPQWLPWWGASLGLALISKYSALFLVPVFAVYILLRRKIWISDKRFWLGLALTTLVVSPVVVYNVMLWQTRGHFDVQWSSIAPGAFFAAQRDWSILFSSPPTRNLLVNLRDLLKSLREAFSWPFAAVLGAGIAVVIFRMFRRHPKREDLFAVLGLASLAAFFTFTAPSLRYLTIFVPWLVLPFALWMARWFSRERKPGGRVLGWGIMAILAVVFGRELWFNWNTNLALAPLGARGRDYAAYRYESFGYQEMQAYLTQRLSENKNFQRSVSVISTFKDFWSIQLKPGDDVVLYDGGLMWFSAIWYLRTLRMYHGALALIYPDDVDALKIIDNWPKFFAENGVHKVYYVVGALPGAYDPWAVEEGEKLPSRVLEKELQRIFSEGAPGTVTEIRNPVGEVGFRVYELPLNP